MRLGHLLLVLAWIGTAASAASRPPLEAAVHARHLFETGVTLERLGQYQQAIDALTQAINTRALNGADAARAVFDRGVAYDALGDTKRAIGDYSAALRLDKGLAAAYNNRANAYRRSGQLEAAKNDYLAALRCPGSDRQYPYYGLGLIAEKLGDGETARDYFQRALAVDPSFALASQSLVGLKRPPLVPPPVVAQRPVVEAAHQPPEPIHLRPPPKPASAAPAFKTPVAAATPAGSQPVLRRAISDTGEHRGAAVGNRGTAAQVQLGSYREEQMASDAWNKIVAQAGAPLAGLAPIIIPADLPGRGRFWRLRVAVSDAKAARALCTSLSQKGHDCLVARN